MHITTAIYSGNNSFNASLFPWIVNDIKRPKDTDDTSPCQKWPQYSPKICGTWLSIGLVAPAICSAHTKLQWFFMDNQYVIITVPVGRYIKRIPTTNQTELAQLLAK